MKMTTKTNKSIKIKNCFFLVFFVSLVRTHSQIRSAVRFLNVFYTLTLCHKIQYLIKIGHVLFSIYLYLTSLLSFSISQRRHRSNVFSGFRNYCVLNFNSLEKHKRNIKSIGGNQNI